MTTTTKTCRRCNGTGRYGLVRVCWGCNGTGAPVVRMTQEELDGHAARVEAKDAERKAARRARAAVRRAAKAAEVVS